MFIFCWGGHVHCRLCTSSVHLIYIYMYMYIVLCTGLHVHFPVILESRAEHKTVNMNEVYNVHVVNIAS